MSQSTFIARTPSTLKGVSIGMNWPVPWYLSKGKWGWRPYTLSEGIKRPSWMMNSGLKDPDILDEFHIYSDSSGGGYSAAGDKKPFNGAQCCTSMCLFAIELPRSMYAKTSGTVYRFDGSSFFDVRPGYEWSDAGDIMFLSEGSTLILHHPSQDIFTRPKFTQVEYINSGQVLDVWEIRVDSEGLTFGPWADWYPEKIF